MNAFKNNSVETVNEVSQKSNEKRDQKVKRIKKKHSRTIPDAQLKEFSLTKQTSRPKTDYE